MVGPERDLYMHEMEFFGFGGVGGEREEGDGWFFERS